MGRWIDFKNDYKTMDPKFMESVWWVFKQLDEKKLVYQGYKVRAGCPCCPVCRPNRVPLSAHVLVCCQVMPYSPACTTPLSNFEAGLNYKDVSDPASETRFVRIGRC